MPLHTDSGAPEVDAGSVSKGSDAAPPTPKDPAECAGSAACQGCCITDFPGGAQFYGIAAGQCICEGVGSCAGVCSSTDCAALGSKDRTCQDCINARMSGTCLPTADMACAADATCKLYAQCLAGCP